MLAFYRLLLYFYPSAYRAEYGEEMLAVLADLQRAVRQKSIFNRAWLGIHESGGLLYGAMQEHVRSITGPYRGMFSPRRIIMRTEYRFPKAAAVLMTIILVAILWTIEKAKTISVAYANAQVSPIKVEVSILPAFAIALVGACVAGAIGWAVIFALRRSGIQRFSDINPSSR